MCSALWKEINVILKTRENSCNCSVHVMGFLWQSTCQVLQNPVEKKTFSEMDGSVVLCAFTQFTSSSPALRLGIIIIIVIIITLYRNKEQQFCVFMPCLCCISDSMIHWFMALEAVITSHLSLPRKICSPEQLLHSWFRICHPHFPFIIAVNEGSAVRSSGAFGSN